jgi:putative ABC transport system permease protein
VTLTSLTFKNLTRNKLRTALRVMAIALPLLVFTVARSFVDVVHSFLQQSDRNMRVAVHHRLSFTTPLPARLRDEIGALAPSGFITAICRTAWFGGRVEGEQTTFSSFGVDRDAFPIVYSEFGMTPQDIEAFTRERRAAVISPSLAAQMNWKIGDTISLTSMLPPNPKMEFVIVAIPPFPQNLDRPVLYMGWDYFDEVWRQVTDNSRGVNNFWLKCSSDEARRWALQEIDKRFANSEHETRTEMESTFIAAFTKSGGDWVGLIWTVGQLVVLVALAVAFNTISTAFRERTREYALLRALGFQRGRIVGLVLAEGLLLGVLGWLVGVAPAAAASSFFSVSLPRFGAIRIPTQTLLMSAGAAVACGLLAALIPAIMAGRLAVASALRKAV